MCFEHCYGNKHAYSLFYFPPLFHCLSLSYSSALSCMMIGWLVRLFLWISVLYNTRTPYSACHLYKSCPADRISWFSFGHFLSYSEQMLCQYPTKCHKRLNRFINHTYPIFRYCIMCLADEASFRWQRTKKLVMNSTGCLCFENGNVKRSAYFIYIKIHYFVTAVSCNSHGLNPCIYDAT